MSRRCQKGGFRLFCCPQAGPWILSPRMGSQNPSPDEKNPDKFRAICQVADTTSRDALNTYFKGPRPSCDMKNLAKNLHGFQPAKITSRDVFHLPKEECVQKSLKVLDFLGRFLIWASRQVPQKSQSASCPSPPNHWLTPRPCSAKWPNRYSTIGPIRITQSIPRKFSGVTEVNIVTPIHSLKIFWCNRWCAPS